MIETIAKIFIYSGWGFGCFVTVCLFIARMKFLYKHRNNHNIIIPPL